MSMLAERKRKTKWVIQPTKKPLWATDSGGIKFGRELMEKMGWSAGKGLGVNEQGIQEPLRIIYKNDTKGIGFKGNDNEWVEQQDEFNELLSQLRKDDDLPNKNVPEKKIKSLEEKSKQSRARVHYQKFTRGKDISRYSENDLDCILGINKTKKVKSKTEEVIQTKLETVDNCKTSFGVITINSGSIQDYFKKKWIFDKNSRNLSAQNEEKIENSNQNFSNAESCLDVIKEENISESKEKIKKRKRKSSSDEEFMSISKTKVHELEGLENNKKKKNKEVENNLEEPQINKRKKHCDGSVFVNETWQGSKERIAYTMNYNEESDILPKKYKNRDINLVKKRKKDQNHPSFENENDFGCVLENEKKNSYKNCISEVLSFKKLNKINGAQYSLDKKKEKCMIALVNNHNNGETSEPNLEIEPVKKKKKKSKKKLERNEKVKSGDDSINQNSDDYKEKIKGLFTTEASEKNSGKHKKKKKDRREDSEERKEIECKNCSHIEKEIKEKDIRMNEEEYKIQIESIKKKKKKKDQGEKESESINCSSNHTEKSNLIKLFLQKNSMDEEDNIKDTEANMKLKNKNKKRNTEDINCHSDHNVQFNLKVQSKEKSVNELIAKTSVQENILEMEAVNKKKKKEKLEEKEIDNYNLIEEIGLEEGSKLIKLIENKKKNKVTEVEYSNNGSGHIEEALKINTISTSKEEYIAEESFKKKKKVKIEKERQNISYPIECNEKFNLKETLKEKSIHAKKQESALQLELFEESDEKKKGSCKNKSTENKEKTQIQENIKKLNTEAVHKRVDFRNINRKNVLPNVLNVREEEDKGVHKHKLALLNEKRADKFYPGGYDRVLRLILWTNIAGFKGSNLEDVSGYGHPKKYGGNIFR